jgi:hypothetical protein
MQAVIKKFPLAQFFWEYWVESLVSRDGLFLGFALGAALASVFHVSSFEGGAGYFAISIRYWLQLSSRQS